MDSTLNGGACRISSDMHLHKEIRIPIDLIWVKDILFCFSILPTVGTAPINQSLLTTPPPAECNSSDLPGRIAARSNSRMCATTKLMAIAAASENSMLSGME